MTEPSDAQPPVATDSTSPSPRVRRSRGRTRKVRSATGQGEAAQAASPGGDEPGSQGVHADAPAEREGRGRFNRRRGGRGATPRRSLQAEGHEGREAEPLTRGVAGPDAAIPVYSSAAAIGVDAADLSRRKGRPDRAREMPGEDAPKLHKILADAGIGSRREMEELIVAGRVSVNGQPAHVGQRIGPNDQIRINGRPLNRRVQRGPGAPRVLLYHKPPGEICSRDDPGQRSTVFDRLPRLKGARWVGVGRLDFNTEGLLIFTTSGEMANILMHPRYGWEREYAVRILGRIDETLRARLLEGISLEDGPAAFSALEDVGGDGANHWYRVVISEGRNREVRRIFEAVGLTVSRLVRIRFGPVGLPVGLARGRWVQLADADALHLMDLLKRTAQGRQDGAPGAQSGSPDALGSIAEAEASAIGSAGVGLDDVDDIDDLDDFDEDDRQPAYLAQVEEPGHRHAAGVNIDDDEWQPKSADAHLSGITRAVRKSTRGERFGAGSGFGQPGLPAAPTGRPKGRGRKPAGVGVPSGKRFGAATAPSFPSTGAPPLPGAKPRRPRDTRLKTGPAGPRPRPGGAPSAARGPGGPRGGQAAGTTSRSGPRRRGSNGA